MVKPGKFTGRKPETKNHLVPDEWDFEAAHDDVLAALSSIVPRMIPKAGAPNKVLLEEEHLQKSPEFDAIEKKFSANQNGYNALGRLQSRETLADFKEEALSLMQAAKQNGQQDTQLMRAYLGGFIQSLKVANSRFEQPMGELLKEVGALSRQRS